MAAHHTDIAGSSILLFVAFGAFVHWLAAQEHWLASVSYILGSIAALTTIYFRIKNRGK